MNLEISDSIKNEFKLNEGENNLPLKVQEFVFIKLANKKQNIKYELPCFNIISAFNDDQQAQQFLKIQDQEFKENDVFRMNTHTLFPICLSRNHQLNIKYSQDIINKKVVQHMDNKRKKDHCFYSRVYKSTDTKSIDDLVEKNFLKSKVSSTNEMTLENINLLPNSNDTFKYAVVVVLDLGTHEIKMENKSIISNIFKRNEVKEPVMSVLALFSNLESAESYCKHTASHQYPFCDIFIVETNKWCSPYIMNKEGLKEIYRNSRLDEIMTVRKEEMEKANEFERKQKEAGIEVNEIVIDNVISSNTS